MIKIKNKLNKNNKNYFFFKIFRRNYLEKIFILSNVRWRKKIKRVKLKEFLIIWWFDRIKNLFRLDLVIIIIKLINQYSVTN